MRRFYNTPRTTAIKLTVESSMMGSSTDPIINVDGPVVGGEGGGEGGEPIEELTRRQDNYWLD